MDLVTYALLKKQIDGITPGYSFKGSVANVAALPASATSGDLYLVESEGNAQFVYNGTEWVQVYSQVASNAQIDGLYS